MKRITKKGLSVLLIFSFILGMVSDFAVSSRAADDTVIYEPMPLDYPVFNSYVYPDANNPLRQQYYEEYAKEKGYYNVVAKFTGFAPNTKYTELKNGTWNDFLGNEGDYYTTSVPYGWMKRDGMLEINLGATIYNEEHEHTKVLGLITANSLNYFSAVFTPSKIEDGKEKLIYKDININGTAYGEGENRVGDMVFMPVKQDQRWLTLKVGPGRTFKECNHQRAYIEDIVVTLRDVGSPTVWKAYPCDVDGNPVKQMTELGEVYLKDNAPYYVKPDATVYIRVDFYEPVRFSDNKATHGDITAKLFTEGTGNLHATGNLYKLKDNYIVFKFENIGNSIGVGTGKSIKLVSLDLSELFGGFELNPMYGNNVQNVKPDSKYKGDGFNSSKSLITDLAGNPLSDSSKRVALSNTCVVDSEPPYIKRVTYTGYMNNTEIKQKVNGETHQSDILAGVGDKIVYTVIFNEQVKTNGVFKTWGQYQYLTARLNVKNNEGENVEIKSMYTQEIKEIDDGAAKTVTTVTFEPFIVLEGMTCDDSDGKIRIIEIMAQGGTVIADIGDNACSFQNQNINEINTNPLTLDTTPPAVQTSQEPDGNGAYIPIVVQKPNQTITQFSFPFTVTDSLGGTDDAYGKFRWVNGKSAGKNYNFWYAVTASNTPPAIGAQEWNPGITGQSYTFDQVSAGNCIHILLADNESYNLGNTRLEFTGYDIAGNFVVTSFPLNYTADTVNPTAEEKSVTNEHDSSNNTEKIKVTARVSDDNSGLKEVFYQWVTDGSIPTQNSSGWTGIGAFSTGDETTDVTVYSAEIASGSKFTGDLYIKAADVFGNTDVIFIGTYTYDFTAPKFVIDYKKTGVSAEASLKITELEDKSAAVFMIQKPGTANTYYVSVVESVYAQCDGIGGDILNNTDFGSDRWYRGILDQFSWQKYEVTRESDSVYDFNFIQNSAWGNFGDDVVLQNILNGNYYGEIKMKLLTGRVYQNTYAFINDDFIMKNIGGNSYQYESKEFPNNNFTYILGDPHYAYPVVYLSKAEGVFVQDITLKTVGKVGVDAYNTSFTVPDSLDIKAEDFNPDDSSTYMRSTLKDVPVNINITARNDFPDWAIEDIDFNETYIRVIRMTDENHNPVNKQVGENLHLYQPSQIIKLPDWDYPGGEYRFELVITSKATGAQYEYYYPSYDGQSNERIYVDSTKASQEFGLAAVRRLVWYDFLNINETSMTYFGPTINAADTEKIPSEYLGDGVITRIPAGDFTEDLYLDFSINDMPVTSQGYYGTKAIKVWNETDGVNAEESKQQSEWRMITNYMNINLYSVRYAAKLVGNASEVTANMGSNTVPLVKDTVNKLGVQVINDNGRISGVRYIYIYPAAQGIQGTISYIPNTAEYVKEGLLQFKPEPGQIMENVSIYARDMIENSTTDITGNYNASENTYSLVLDKPGNHGYYLYAIDGEGNYTNISKDGYRQWIYTDPGAPVVMDAEITNLPNGKYEATYVFSEDTIVDSKPQTLSLYFDDAYMNELGFVSNSNDAFTVSLPVNKNAGKQTAYEISDSNPYGIYKVETEPVEGQGKQIRVTVYGVSKYNDSIPEGNMVTHTLYATLTDPFGYESEPGAGVVIEAENTRPQLIKGNIGHYGSAMSSYNLGFNAEFNTPVRLNKSIAAKIPSGYSEIKNGELPIFDEGSYTISFYDVFGIEWVQDITVTAPKEFRPYGFKILVSETDYTRGPVTISITSKDGTIFWVYDSTDGRWDKIDEDMFPTTEATFEVEDNKELTLVLRYMNISEHVKLYITNIVKDPPQATVKWYFHEFVSNDPEGITETSGPVTASYETNVPTVPYGGTMKSYTFYPGNPTTSYTFEFIDKAGNIGSVTADLEAMGISFVTPSEPVQDNTSPEYDIYVYRMTENAYESLGLCEGSGTTVTLDDVLKEAGYAKGYKLLLHITDPSPYRIILLADKNADTQNITYNSESEPVDGVTLSGNLLTITRAAGFKVVIVDSYNNQTSFTVDLGKYLDNTPPEAVLTKVNKDSYTVVQYINLTDKSDNGGDTGFVKLMSPVLYKVDDVSSPFYGQYYYEFTENKSFDITFSDSAGNIAVETVSVDDLDLGWPEDTVEWYPYGIDEETGKGDPTRPPARKTAKDVMATVKYSRPISSVSASISLDDGLNWTPVKDISDAGSYIEVMNTSDTATVIFKQGGFMVELIAETPNGLSVYSYLSLDDIIDKTPPQVKQEVIYSYNTGYESGVPISARVLLTPQDEDVYCTSLPGKLIRKGESVSFTVSNKGNYLYSFADEVGNTTIITAVVDRDMDRTPPETVITKPDSGTATGGLVPVTISANEPGKLKVRGVDYAFDADITSTQKTVQIQIGNNGSYEVTAVDEAGNRATAVFTVGNIDKTAPGIALSPSTVNIRQDSSAEELDALLASGWSVYDNISPSSAITLDYDPTVVNLTRPGVYTVEYTALDEAGNQGTAKRFVRVYSKNEVEVLVNGLKTFRDETTIVQSKTLSVTVNNPQTDEPYTVYLSRGINSEGQMKSNYIIIKPGQSFTVDSKGFYTLYIVTQSRQTYMTKLYVEE